MPLVDGSIILHQDEVVKCFFEIFLSLCNTHKNEVALLLYFAKVIKQHPPIYCFYCKICPFVKKCKAYAAGAVDLLPIRTAKVQTANRYFTYIYVKQGSDTWLHRRPAGDIWQGLYELPMLETPKAITADDLKKTDFWKNTFGRKSPLLVQGPVKHVLSHRVIYAWFYEVQIPPASAVAPGYIKVAASSLEKYAFARLVQKFLAAKK